MNKPSVLIIDDEIRLLKSLSILLEEHFRVYTASSGKEGLFIVKNSPLSIVLLDLNMPEMNGVEVLKKIREISSDLKVIIITGGKEDDWTVKCENMHIQGYMEKPFQFEHLLEELNYLVDTDNSALPGSSCGKNKEPRNTVTSEAVQKILNYVEKNWQENISREEIATRLGITPEHLSRSFHEQFGLPLIEYINRCKIDKSREYLLKNSHLKIGEVAAYAGIPDVDYFCRLFKKHTGLTPGEFRKKIQIT